MRFKIVIFFMVLLVVSLSSAYAGNEDRNGTAGAQELLIPIGSRGAAMGGSVLSTTSGVEAMYWNPAGLASLEGTEVMFTHLPYLADIDVNFVGVATNIEGFGTLGFGAKVVSIGDIIETTETRPDGTGRDFSPSLMVFNVSFAKVMTANVSFGVNALYIYEDVFEVSATGMAFDAGFTYDPRWNGISIGVAIKNYGGEMQYTGIGFDRTFANHQVRATSAKFDLPSSIDLGIAYDFINEGANFASLSGTFQGNNYSQDIWRSGAEYVYDGKYSLRGGYSYSEEENYIYGLSFGAGLTVPLGESNLKFEYTWMETDVFDANQFFTVTANF